MGRDRLSSNRKDERYGRRRSRSRSHSPGSSREPYSRRYRDRDFRDRDQWRRRSDHRARSRSRSKSEPEWDAKKQIPETKKESQKSVVSPAIDAAAIAASAAARINALISSKKLAEEHNAAEGSASPVIPGTSSGNEEVSKPVLVRTVNINDLRNKYLLTKPDMQEKISKETNTKVTTGGRYYPDSSLSTEANPPLHVRVEADNEEALEKALEKIDELINQELGDLIDQKRLGLMRKGGLLPDDLAIRGLPADGRLASNRLLEGPAANNETNKEVDNNSTATATIAAAIASPQPPSSESPSPFPTQRHQADIPIRLDRYIRPFQARGVVVGQGGANVKHIQNETGVRVQVKGRGSGFLDKITGKEEDRDMYLHVYRGTAEQIQKAKELCEDLVNTMCEQYESGSDKSASETKTNVASRVPTEKIAESRNSPMLSGPPGLKVNMLGGAASGPPGLAPGPPGLAPGMFTNPGVPPPAPPAVAAPPPPPPVSNIAFHSVDSTMLSPIRPPVPPPQPPMGMPASAPVPTPAPPPPI